MCSNCNMSSFPFIFSIHLRDNKLIDLMMTSESVMMLGSYATKMISPLNVSAIVSSSPSTRLLIQPPVSGNAASVLKVFGNGSLQLCGSPNDIEHLFSALFAIMQVVMKAELITFLSTMRRVGSFEG